MWVHLALPVIHRVVLSGLGVNHDTLWQLELHQGLGKSSVSWQVEKHRDQVPLHSGLCLERDSEDTICTYKWAGDRHPHEGLNERKVNLLHR